jgi:hypothetical protein
LIDIHQATRNYESWLRQHTDVVESDLRFKHERMAESPFVFLRGTFYRWIQQWPVICEKLHDAPLVLAVGDLHVENFGTWRDCEGRLIWGVNDVDEAYDLPYTQDLVRLATSAILAIRGEHFSLSAREACEAILDGYRASLDRGGRPVVLAERHRWLRQIALNDLRDPTVFWTKLEACQDANGPRKLIKTIPYRELRSMMPEGASIDRVVRRVAGVGSLGRPRLVALARLGGSLIAREAKALLPSAVVWARGVSSAGFRGGICLDRAVRVPDPYFAVKNAWILRRLAPDCTRIELSQMPKKRDEAKLLRAMAWETANVHLGSRRQVIARDAAERSVQRLRRAAGDMAEAVIDDWHQWVGRRAPSQIRSAHRL